MVEEDFVVNIKDCYSYHKSTLNRVLEAISFIENEMAYHGGIFAMTDNDVEKLLSLDFKENLETYYELHYLFRKLNVEFMWMKTTHRCAFMKLNKINMLEPITL